MKRIIGLMAAAAPMMAFGEANVPDSVGDARIMEYNDTSYHVRTLHQNAPHLVNVPDVPRFALFGKEGKFYMGIGANIKNVGEYDFGHPIENPDKFMPSQIPMQIAPGNGANFRYTAQQSNLYLNIVALPGSKDQLGAFVSINFTGDNYAPKLNHAYLKFRGMISGYTFSLFSDGSATPAMIDKQGPAGFTGVIHGMFGYEPTFGKNHEWKAGIGIDMPENTFTTGEYAATVNQRVPDIPFYVQRSWADGEGKVRLSGMVRNLFYRNLAAEKNVDVVGWGIKASGKSPIAGGLKCYWQALYGKGIAGYIQDLGGSGMDLMPDPENPSHLKAVKAWSGYAALQYDFNPDLFCTAVYSHVRTYADMNESMAQDFTRGYRYAQYVGCNIFYNVNSIVQVGAEYLYGRRVDYSGAQAHDNRIEAMLKVSF